MKPANIDKPPVHIAHSDLTRFQDDSAYKSECPACDRGVLAVRREPGTLNLLRADNCLGCGQRVVYTDRAINGETLYPEKHPGGATRS